VTEILPTFCSDKEARAALVRINAAVDGGTFSIGARLEVGLTILTRALLELPPAAAGEVADAIGQILAAVATDASECESPADKERLRAA